MEYELTDEDKRLSAIDSVGDDTVNRNIADASNENLLTLTGRAYDNTLAPYSTAIVRLFAAPDAEFSLDDNWKELTENIPGEYHDSFNSVRSMQEGYEVRQGLQTQLDNTRLLGAAGVSGTVANLLSMIASPENVLMNARGLYATDRFAALAGKAKLSGKVNTIAATSLATAATAAAFAVVTTQVDPMSDWTRIPDAALGGLMFGAALGTLTPTRAVNMSAKALEKARQEFALAKERGFDVSPAERPVRQNYEQEMADLEKQIDAGGDRSVLEPQMDVLAEKRIAELKRTAAGKDSVGSASLRTQPLDPVFQNEDTAKLLAEVRADNVKQGHTGDVWENSHYTKNNLVSKTAQRLYEVVSGTPWADDHARLWNSDSIIAKHFAIRMLESPSGFGQMRNRTSAILMPQYTTEVVVPFAKAYHKEFNNWLRESKSAAPTPLAWNDLNTRQAFERQVMLELHTRYHDKVSAPTSNNSVKAMADAYDEASARAVDVLQGRPGENPVHGSENLKAKSGWTSQPWSGQNILKAIFRAENKFGAKNGRGLIVDALSVSYMGIHKWSKDIADVVANAVINGSIARSEGVNTNLFRTMSPDNFEYLREVLKNDLVATGMTAEKIDKTVDATMGRIRQDNADRGKIKHLKERNDIDLRTPIVGTDMTLMDLIEMDMNKTWTQYARTTAGASATARNGIQFGEIRSRWIPAMKDELRSRGGKMPPEEFFDALESYFSGRAYSGGINPNIRRLMTLTNLSLLNTLGLTQTAELGAAVGAMHLDNFIHALPEELKYIVNGKMSAVHEDLQYIDSSIIGDHNIYRPEYMQNETRSGALNSELGRNIDSLLAKGARAQGFISGFYKVNQLMQRMSGNTLLRRLNKVANGKPMGELRMRSLGFTAENEERIMKYFKDGTVTVGANGEMNLHVSKWASADFQELAAIIVRNSAQSVQKAFRGEDAYWVHQDTGAFLMYLKSFTFTALHKQLIRNMRIADTESLAITLFGLGTAAAAYTGKQYVSGNQDKLTGEKLMKGMLSYSNMTAPIVQFTDPVFGMLGLDDLTMGGGNSHGGSSDLLAMPPVFNAVNRIKDIPKAAVHAATGNLTKNDVYAFTAAPLMGNLYGAGYIANSMRDDIDAKKRKAKAEKELKAEPKVSAPPESSSLPALTPAKSTNSDTYTILFKLGEEQ